MNAIRPSVLELGVDRAPRRVARRLGPWVLGWLLITAVLALASLLIGTSSLQTSLGWLINPDAQTSVILWQIRLPRTAGAWCAGALLGLAGAIAQGLFRNPLAEPYLLGTASGAALGVTVTLIAADASLAGLAWTSQLGLTLTACIGAAGATLLTLSLSRGVLQTSRLLLAGVVVAFLLSALTQLMLLTRPEIWRTMQIFLLGDTALLSWSSTALLATVLLVCAIPATLLARGLDALTLGEDTARSLGLSLPVLRLVLLGIVSLATASTVGQVGVVGFVGLVAPHLVRETLSVNHRQLLVAAPLCGGALLQAADLVSRWVIRPAELPVGAVTACVGGAYLVVLLWRRNRHG
ncbi:MAG TPA: iron ABC transporter permease [Steroidobacteraceae bacterium]|nr:iron ABC transporter permease [Steroidobacteraceae bacterium]